MSAKGGGGTPPNGRNPSLRFSNMSNISAKIFVERNSVNPVNAKNISFRLPISSNSTQAVEPVCYIYFGIFTLHLLHLLWYIYFTFVTLTLHLLHLLFYICYIYFFTFVTFTFLHLLNFLYIWHKICHIFSFSSNSNLFCTTFNSLNKDTQITASLCMEWSRRYQGARMWMIIWIIKSSYYALLGDEPVLTS